MRVCTYRLLRATHLNSSKYLFLLDFRIHNSHASSNRVWCAQTHTHTHTNRKYIQRSKSNWNEAELKIDTTNSHCFVLAFSLCAARFARLCMPIAILLYTHTSPRQLLKMNFCRIVRTSASRLVGRIANMNNAIIFLFNAFEIAAKHWELHGLICIRSIVAYRPFQLKICLFICVGARYTRLLLLIIVLSLSNTSKIRFHCLLPSF